jgi:hypothetical protein
MEHTMIKALLEKYWLAETTVEEEKALATYFRGPDIDPELAPFGDLFAYFEEETRIETALTPGAGFESRILERIARAEAADGSPHTSQALLRSAAPSRVFFPRRWLNPAYAAAAAVILSIGLFIMYQPNRPAAGPATPVTAGANTAATTIKDTYDDPQQALAAIRHALLTASARMNQGKNITQKNMDQLKKLKYGQL